MSWTMGENNGEESVVVEMVMPKSECKFTLAGNVEQQLPVLGCSAVVSGYHAIFGTAKIQLVVDGRWI